MQNNHITIEDINEILPNSSKKLTLTQKEAAQVIGVASGTLEKWRANAKGPNYIKDTSSPKCRVLYPKKSVVEYLSNVIVTI